jgi:hypothetical protein
MIYCKKVSKIENEKGAAPDSRFKWQDHLVLPFKPF